MAGFKGLPSGPRIAIGLPSGPSLGSSFGVGARLGSVDCATDGLVDCAAADISTISRHIPSGIVRPIRYSLPTNLLNKKPGKPNSI